MLIGKPLRASCSHWWPIDVQLSVLRSFFLVTGMHIRRRGGFKIYMGDLQEPRSVMTTALGWNPTAS